MNKNNLNTINNNINNNNIIITLNINNKIINS
jgi:hypothetical protein